MNARAQFIFNRIAPPLLLLAAGIAIWQAAVVGVGIRPFLLPAPWQVVRAAYDNWALLINGAWATAQTALAGFAISMSSGLAVATLFSQSRWIERGFYPYAIFLQTTPIVAVAPILILWFGYGFFGIVAVTFIISVFPIITNATTGLRAVDPNFRELFEMQNASRWQTLIKLRLPTSIPYLVAGAKTSCGLCVIGAIVGEVFAGANATTKGLGYLIQQTSGQLKTDFMFAAVLCSTLLGVAVFGAVSTLGELVLSRWRFVER